jgi:hypothetical protein
MYRVTDCRQGVGFVNCSVGDIDCVCGLLLKRSGYREGGNCIVRNNVARDVREIRLV